VLDVFALRKSSGAVLFGIVNLASHLFGG
jgi:hypothetical protein